MPTELSAGPNAASGKKAMSFPPWPALAVFLADLLAGFLAVLATVLVPVAYFFAALLGFFAAFAAGFLSFRAIHVSFARSL